ncbi:Retrovirus-related Pol polyprotein from transposon RE1 [Vitis vinifera]|uniref:Retrovirus-related Pol polyprotein from transposon RE1 n=1 Tax=Vitis vinifera TaxID=29760 RepID=A0A438FTC1_VITVI|nr:Retrovirus-related Pol polyprotein from transposon RE1 [Vitis vinifera]
MATKSSTFSSVISGSPMITSEKLVDSENYLSWSAFVELWFMGQGYEDHLVTQEADIPEVDKVQRRKIDAQLCSVLWQSVDPKILLHLRAYKTCFKFWNQAKRLYTNDIQRLYKVASSIVNVRQQDMDLSTYIGQIASLKEEFLIVMPLTTDVGDQRTQIDKFFMVLMLIGLRPDLETVRDQILAVPPFHPWMIGNRGRGQRPHCTYCNKLGHTRDRCYQLHGRPPRTAHMAQSSDPQLPQPPSSSTSQGISLTDSEYDDYLRYEATKSAYVAQTGNASACLTHTSSLGPWILDSGSSDHISGNKDLFSSITTTSILPTVTLANGSQTMAKGFGFAHSLPFLPLHSVLYAPECPCNLISISKITRTLNRSITFSDKFVTLQDRSTGKTIGIGRESQGPYHLTSPSTPAVCISTDAPLLIHSRLGHPSLSKFQKMVPRFSSLSSLACESCQLGKHTRVSFLKCLNNQDKLSAKATKCIFLGYSRLQKGYRCYSSETPRYFLSADVTFFEYSPFFSTSESLPVSEVLPRPIISPPDGVPANSLPIPSASPAPALPPSADLPIALWKGWRQAMVDEMAALHSNGTWDLVVLPSGKSTIGCHWVYTVKVGPDGQVDRLKARLVAKGYTQVYGSDYDDTFSPVAKIAFVHLLLSMAAMRSWPLYQVDIKNVFLHGDLAEEVYMEKPPGFVAQGESGLVCSTVDHPVFYHHNSSGQCIYLVVYVDDIVITGSDQNDIQKLKQHLFTHFQTKDLGKLKYFLGIEIAQSSSGVVLSQMKYALDILEETGMLDCKPVDTPMDPNVKLIPGQGEPLGDPGRYRRLVGKLNYLTITRPDISFHISVVSQFLQSPCDSHWDAVIRILRYIKSTPGQGVLYENRDHTQIVGYTDADWAGSPTDRRSTSGYCVFIGATCELIWLKHLLQELRFGNDEQMKLICDNQAALHIASNPVFHERTKHIKVDCHFIKEKIALGCVATSFVNSNDQLADIFTKSLKGPRIKYICNKLGAYNIYAPA